MQDILDKLQAAADAFTQLEKYHGPANDCLCVWCGRAVELSFVQEVLHKASEAAGRVPRGTS
jgi:hypothetical protein